MTIYREITGDDDPAFYAEDGIGTPLKEKKPRRIWAVPLDGPVYRLVGPDDLEHLLALVYTKQHAGEVVELLEESLVEVGEDSTP